jgi:hypothetical protein
MIENANVIDKLKNKYLILAIGLLVSAYLVFAAIPKHDFYIYLLAAQDMFAGKNMYEATYVDGYHYFYSALFTCFIYLFTFLPVYAATLIWLLLNALCLIRAIKIVSGYFNIRALPVKQQWIFLTLCTLACVKFALANIEAQQITIIIFWMVLEGLEKIWKGKIVLGALLIALAINFKLLPILLLPYLIYRREFIATFLIVVFYGISLELPVLIIGTARNKFLLLEWWKLINPTNQRHVLDTDEGGFASVTTWLSTLLVYQEPKWNELKVNRNIANLSITQLGYIINIVRLLFLAFSLYFFRTWPFVKKVGKTHRFWELSYFLIIIPLLFPHQQYYSFLFVAPALCYIYYQFMMHYTTMSRLKYRLTIAAMTLSFLLCNLGFIIGALDGYFRHFKILTYGILLIVLLLAVSKPEAELKVESEK